MKNTFITILFALLVCSSAYPQQNQTEKGKKQFLYLLRLEKTMYDSAAWTPEKNKIVQVHFEYLKSMLANGKLILAGRTQVEDSKTFGIVIFEADNIEEAKTIAENDPAVKGKIMTVEVYPYSIALMKGAKE